MTLLGNRHDEWLLFEFIQYEHITNRYLYASYRLPDSPAWLMNGDLCPISGERGKV
jgi:hypothetical protein